MRVPARTCCKTTRANLNKRMAVVLIEKRRETIEVDGKKVTRDVTDEEVINDATIRGVFSNQFQITGLGAGEARDLALLLRSGVARHRHLSDRGAGRRPERSGAENIQKGVHGAARRHGGRVPVHGHLLPHLSAWWPTWCCSPTWCC